MKGSLQLGLSIILLLCAVGCGSRKSALLFEMQSPDKMLFDRGAEALAAQRYQDAITLFETLRNAYPDSEYAERAKLALIDCDRIEACASVHPQAGSLRAGEVVTFFPNMPESKPRHRKKLSANH